jgi:hypothetical protein
MEHSIATRAEDLALLLRDHLGVRGGDGFAAKLDYAGRRLPKWAHKDGAVIVEALGLEAHPKLARQIDQKRVRRALRNLEDYLGAIDPTRRRVERAIDIAAFVGFVAFSVLVCFLAVMVWRGLI